MAGIISYGVYVPLYRLRTSDIAAVWGKEDKTAQSLGVYSKTVAGHDEDAVTLGFEAAISAINRISFNPKKIGSLFVGSESHPYVVNPASTIISEFLNIGNDYFASDLEFACKAATTAMIITSALVDAEKINYGLIIGTDCAQAKPGDILEYTASSAAASFILGNARKEIIAEIMDYCSYSSDTPDFWRRDGVSYPSHGGRFTGEPGYFAHILGAAKNLLEKTKMKPSDFSYCVFHMPNSKFPKKIAKLLGFTQKQLEKSLIVSEIGNPYSSSSLLGLANVLDTAKPNEKIFFVSYGSGAGADAIIFETTKRISAIKKKGFSLKEILQQKKNITYTSYLKMRQIL